MNEDLRDTVLSAIEESLDAQLRAVRRVPRSRSEADRPERWRDPRGAENRRQGPTGPIAGGSRGRAPAAVRLAVYDHLGREVSLGRFENKQHVMLLFYPLDWTPT